MEREKGRRRGVEREEHGVHVFHNPTYSPIE